MVSLTPVYPQKVPRPIEVSEFTEFKNVIDMFNKLNEVLSKAHGFSLVPETRSECKILSFQQTKGTAFSSRQKEQAVCDRSRARMRKSCLATN